VVVVTVDLFRVVVVGFSVLVVGLVEISVVFWVVVVTVDVFGVVVVGF